MCEMIVIGKGLLHCLGEVRGDWGVSAMRRLSYSGHSPSGSWTRVRIFKININIFIYIYIYIG